MLEAYFLNIEGPQWMDLFDVEAADNNILNHCTYHPQFPATLCPLD